MAEFKVGIPIIYQLFCVNFANRERLHFFAKSIGEFVEGMTTLIAQAVPSPKSVSRGRTM